MKHAVFKYLTLTAVFVMGMMLPFSNACAQPLEESPLELTAPCYLLMEAPGGTVIFEKNGDMPRPAASITKLMTALLVMERLESGQISLQDSVTVSENAASATGSQVLLDAHASYPLETLLKATIMSSGNDSAVALAEYLGGTEENFVQMMNERAKELGLKNTQYQNCTGLPAPNHYTTARDVALLSLEVSKHPVYYRFSSLWLDSLLHPSGRKTDLVNTNRLIRFYPDCDGFKTGSTNEAKYCLSATAQKNGIRLIAVVLGASTSQNRFNECRAMMDYGFSSYRRAQIGSEGKRTGQFIPVKLGAQDQVEAALGKTLSLLLKNGQEKQLTMEAQLAEELHAPVEKGEQVGKIRILLHQQVIAEIPAVAADAVHLPGFLEGFVTIGENWQ